MSRTAQDSLPKDLAWVPELCRSTYFLPCPNHQVSTGKGELTNLFCLKTQETLCSSCAGGREVVQVSARTSFHARISIRFLIGKMAYFVNVSSAASNVTFSRRADVDAAFPARDPAGFFRIGVLLSLVLSPGSCTTRGSPPGTTDLAVTRPERSRDAWSARSRLK